MGLGVVTADISGKTDWLSLGNFLEVISEESSLEKNKNSSTDCVPR